MAFGDDFERDTRTIREWVGGGAVMTEKLDAELRGWIAYFDEMDGAIIRDRAATERSEGGSSDRREL